MLISNALQILFSATLMPAMAPIACIVSAKKNVHFFKLVADLCQFLGEN